MITNCPQCGQQLRAPDNTTNVKLRCPKCRCEFRCPSWPTDSTARAKSSNAPLYIFGGIALFILLSVVVQYFESERAKRRAAESDAMLFNTAGQFLSGFSSGYRNSQPNSPPYRPPTGIQFDVPPVGLDGNGNPRPGYRAYYGPDGKVTGYSRESP
jgi:hypothetical protein